MRALKARNLSYRAQALITLAIVAFWYGDVWLLRRPGDRAPAICEALAFVLPIFTAALSYIILDTRMRNRQPSNVWFYVGFLAGLVPRVSICV
jgi:hypothetical protein